MNTEVSKDMSNIEEVLSLIASCVDGGGNNTAASSLQVGFNDASIRRLSLAIKEGNKNLQKEIENISNNVSDAYEKREKLLSDYASNILDLAKEDAKRQEKIEKNLSGLSASLRHPIIAFSKNFPVITSIASSIWKITESLYDIQIDNLNHYKDLINNGVLYQKDFDQLHKDAAYLGIRADELANAYIKNSQYLAKLGGLTGNTTDSFNRLLRSIKDTSIELGMNFSTSLDIASLMIRTNFTKMDEGSDAFDRLINTTQIYQKYLQKLSFATGKSVENILQEQKAREQEIAYNAWVKDGRNAPIASFLNAIGASKGIIDAFVTGMPNEEFTQAAISSPEMGRILTTLMEISNDRTLTPEQQMERINELGLTIDKEQLQSVLNYPRPLLNAYPSGVQNGFMMGLNMSTMNWNEAMGYKEIPEIFQQVDKLSDNFTKIIETFFEKISVNKDSLNIVTGALELSNKILKELGKDGGTIDVAMSRINVWMKKLFDFIGSFDSEKMNQTMDGIEIFFFRLNRAIGYLLNGNYRKAYSALTETSEGEQKILQNNYKAQISSNDQKLEEIKKQKEELEQKEKLTTDEIKKLESLEKEERELLKKNKELNELHKKSLERENALIDKKSEEMRLKDDGIISELFNTIVDLAGSTQWSSSASADMLKEIDTELKKQGILKDNLFTNLDKTLEKIQDDAPGLNSYIRTGKDLKSDFEKALTSEYYDTDYERRHFLALHGEAILEMTKQTMEMKSKNDNQISNDDITKIMETYAKNNTSYHYTNEEKIILQGILDILSKQYVSNELKDTNNDTY